MSVVTIESGLGDGYTAKIDSTGSAFTKPGPASVATTTKSIVYTGTGTVVVPSRTGRRQIQIQNLDPLNPVHIRLAGTPASASDYRIDPGAVFAFPPVIAYEGEINGIAVGAAVNIAAIEYYA